MRLIKTYWHGSAEALPYARRCITTTVGPYVRRVFIDRDGKPVATGWFTV